MNGNAGGARDIVYIPRVYLSIGCLKNEAIFVLFACSSSNRWVTDDGDISSWKYSHLTHIFSVAHGRHTFFHHNRSICTSLISSTRRFAFRRWQSNFFVEFLGSLPLKQNQPTKNRLEQFRFWQACQNFSFVLYYKSEQLTIRTDDTRYILATRTNKSALLLAPTKSALIRRIYHLAQWFMQIFSQ